MEVADIIQAVEAVKSDTGNGRVIVIIQNKVIKVVHENKARS